MFTQKNKNTKRFAITIIASCAAALLALYCSLLDFNNPIDPKFKYTLTVNAGEGGTVSIDPEQDIYVGGTEVTITATANVSDGYVFAGWGGDTSTNSTITVIMDENKTLDVFFELFTYSLTILHNPRDISGNFLVNGRAVDNVSNHIGDSEIEVCVGSHSGYIFDEWSGDNINDENKTEECITLTMTRDKSLTAHFTPAFDLTINREIRGGGVGGVITIDTTSGTNPFSPSTFPNMTNHLLGAKVRVCATVNDDYIFVGWSGTVNLQNLCVDVDMTRNIELTATFARQVTLNFSATTNTNQNDQTGGRIIVLNGEDTVRNQVVFDAGTELTLCAIVNNTYRFDGWNGDLTGTTQCQTLTMNEDKIVTATFSRPRLRVTRALVEGGRVDVYNSSNNNLIHNYGVDDPNPATSRHPLPAITLNLCARADEGFMFVGWSGDVMSDDECIILEMDINRDVTANFRIGFNPDIVYGTLIDFRDGQEYRTVTIHYGDLGISRTWMAENLNYATSSGSWCYVNSETNCDIYGRLYNWNTAMAGATSSSGNPSRVQGICPSGWHLPSRAEWAALTDEFGAHELKSSVGWAKWGSGSNETGFTAIPGGFRFNVSFGGISLSGYWWTTTENSANNAWYLNMNSENYDVESDHTDKARGFSVRCVMD